MSQFLKENTFQGRNLTENRVLMLSQKINNLKFGHKAQVQRKFDSLEKQVEDLEVDLEAMASNFSTQCFDIKLLFTKINKELAYDYQGTDAMVKEEINRCEQRYSQLTRTHIDDRKGSDARLCKFIDEKCCVLRDLIQRQIQQRSNKGREIEDSLTKDLNEIREKLQDQKRASEENIQQIHGQFAREYEAMQSQFMMLCGKYTDSEGQFYKMLRDVLKKVKNQIAEGKRNRQEMEETILVLIQKICDKAMEEVKVR